MTAEIICVGTEILLGNIVNTNAAYLSERLASIGDNVFFETTVGDNPERLENVIRQGLERSDIFGLNLVDLDQRKTILQRKLQRKHVDRSCRR